MKVMVVFTILCALMCVISCDDDGVSNNETSSVIMPLTVGNSWTWERLGRDTLGDTIWIDTCHNIVVSDTTIDSETWYKLVSNCGKVGLKANRSDGLWSRISPDETDLIAKYPASVGDHWFNQGSTTQLSTIVTDTVITVPAGTYSCIGYQWDHINGSNSFGINFYAVNIGIVMHQYWPYGSLEEQVTTTLIDFDLK
ncbi:MAG: hypothetical protein DRP47_02195 [Candidatus Zixiibacteriota bacterium]|nr:MAG: hypothetical protein DRP47_02195 [candidate division Zixibacteria bacterium]